MSFSKYHFHKYAQSIGIYRCEDINQLFTNNYEHKLTKRIATREILLILSMLAILLARSQRRSGGRVAPQNWSSTSCASGRCRVRAQARLDGNESVSLDLAGARRLLYLYAWWSPWSALAGEEGSSDAQERRVSGSRWKTSGRHRRWAGDPSGKKIKAPYEEQEVAVAPYRKTWWNFLFDFFSDDVNI